MSCVVSKAFNFSITILYMLSFISGFLSWFRNGLLATGIGVIAFVQSDVGREAGYGTGYCLVYFPPVSFSSPMWKNSLFLERMIK